MDNKIDIYGATLRGLRSEVDKRRALITKSLKAIPNQESDYAQNHRNVLAVHYDVLALIETRLFEAGQTLN